MLKPAHYVRLSEAILDYAKPAAKYIYQRPIIEISRLYRQLLTDTTFIGVTGSCGKTTTKDLIAAVLGSHLQGSKSYDSNNDVYAVARTLLSTGIRSRFCVQELGVGRPGGFDRAIRLLRPQIGVVTNVGSDHYRTFRSLEAVAAEKGKLITALPKNGIAILNVDDPHVLAMQSRYTGQVITFGLSNTAIVQGCNVKSAWPERLTFTVSHGAELLTVKTQLCGAHWVHSVLAALAVGVVMGIPLANAARAVETVRPWQGRMAPMEVEGITFIRDDWKAPFWSIPTALEFMRAARATRKVLVIGTISDNGGDSRGKYKKVARMSLEVADQVLFVGRNARQCLKARRHANDHALQAFTTVREASAYLDSYLRPGDLVLLKGSQRADHLGRIALARRKREVGCWRTVCGRQTFCEDCAMLGVNQDPDHC